MEASKKTIESLFRIISGAETETDLVRYLETANLNDPELASLMAPVPDPQSERPDIPHEKSELTVEQIQRHNRNLESQHNSQSFPNQLARLEQTADGDETNRIHQTRNHNSHDASAGMIDNFNAMVNQQLGELGDPLQTIQNDPTNLQTTQYHEQIQQPFNHPSEGQNNQMDPMQSANSVPVLHEGTVDPPALDQGALKNDRLSASSPRSGRRSRHRHHRSSRRSSRSKRSVRDETVHAVPFNDASNTTPLQVPPAIQHEPTIDQHAQTHADALHEQPGQASRQTEETSQARDLKPTDVRSDSSTDSRSSESSRHRSRHRHRSTVEERQPQFRRDHGQTTTTSELPRLQCLSMVQSQQMTSPELKRAKARLLATLDKFKRKGYQLSRTFSIDDPIEDIRFELDLHKGSDAAESSVAMMKTGLLLFFGLVEKVGTRLPFLKLEGLANHIESSDVMKKFDAPLERMYYRLWKKGSGSMNPFLEIGLLIVFAIGGYHLAHHRPQNPNGGVYGLLNNLNSGGAAAAGGGGGGGGGGLGAIMGAFGGGGGMGGILGMAAENLRMPTQSNNGQQYPQHQQHQQQSQHQQQQPPQQEQIDLSQSSTQNAVPENALPAMAPLDI